MAFLQPRCALLTLAAFLGACTSKPAEDGDSTSGGSGGHGAIDGGAAAGGGASGSGWGGKAGRPPREESTAGASGSTAGSSSSMSGSAGSIAPMGGSGTVGCDSGDNTAGFAQACLSCARDACEACLCSDCTEQLQQCAATPGCAEIVTCTRQSGCTGINCYCGDFAAAACLQGQANGPCKSVILDAPGGRVPTLVNPSGGPASDAAVAISTCSQAGHPCAADCSSK